jgi:hypothetical protein
LGDCLASGTANRDKLKWNDAEFSTDAVNETPWTHDFLRQDGSIFSAE